MRRFKKQISVVTLLFIMCCFIVPVMPAKEAEAAEGTSLTDAQINAVIDWAYVNAVGSSYSNYQCLAYVYQAYHNAIGVNIGPNGSYSSAIEASRSLPLHSGDAPRGAIVFWEAAPSNGYYGHAGISVGGGRAISANVTWSKYPGQKVFEHSLEGFLLYDNSGRKLRYIGWAWPYGTEGGTSIQNNPVSSITETNAVLRAKVLNKYQRVTEVGCYLSTDGSNWTYKASDAVNITDIYTNVWYDNIARDFGVVLQPGTTYYYKFYAVVNGVYSEGDIDSFKTESPENGITDPPVNPPEKVKIENNSVANITDRNAKLSAKVLNHNQRVTEVGCYLGKNKTNLNYKASDQVDISDVYTNVWYENIPVEFGIALEANTTYYYQFYTVVNGQRYQGDIGSFTTTKKTEQKPVETEPKITFSNLSVSNITQTNAVFTANITNSGGGTITEVGCYVGLNQQANQWRARKTNVAKGTETLKFDLRQNFKTATISPGKTYYYKFYAIVNGKTIESNIKSFQLLSTTDALGQYLKALTQAAVEDKLGDLRDLLEFRVEKRLGVSDADIGTAKKILGDAGDAQAVFTTLRISSEHFISLGDAIGRLWVVRMENIEEFQSCVQNIQQSSIKTLASAYELGKQDRETQTTANLAKVQESERRFKEVCDDTITRIQKETKELYMIFHPNLKKEMNSYRKSLENLKKNYNLEAFYQLGRYGTGE